MNWQNVKLSECDTFFSYDGDKIFGKVFITALKFHAPGFAPVRVKEGWYHINSNGEELYKERYERAFGFYCNRSAIVGDDGWFHINEKGNRFYKENYAWVGNYQEDKCAVRDFHDSYFHIDIFGQRIYAEEYFYAGDFKDGYACVKTKEGWRHINSKGINLNDKTFYDLGIFHKGIATAKNNQGWFHINKVGDPIYANQYYLSIEPFYNGISLVTKMNGSKSLIDESGRLISDIK